MTIGRNARAIMGALAIALLMPITGSLAAANGPLGLDEAKRRLGETGMGPMVKHQAEPEKSGCYIGEARVAYSKYRGSSNSLEVRIAGMARRSYSADGYNIKKHSPCSFTSTSYDFKKCRMQFQIRAFYSTPDLGIVATTVEPITIAESSPFSTSSSFEDLSCDEYESSLLHNAGELKGKSACSICSQEGIRCTVRRDHIYITNAECLASAR